MRTERLNIMRNEISRRMKRKKDSSSLITNMTMLAILYQNLSNSCLDIQLKKSKYNCSVAKNTTIDLLKYKRSENIQENVYETNQLLKRILNFCLLTFLLYSFQSLISICLQLNAPLYAPLSVLLQSKK
jgi:hypothetical protein